MRLTRLLALALLAVVLAFVTGELMLRVLAKRDADNQLWVGPIPLRPYKVAVRRVAEMIAEAERKDALVVYDPLVGWSVRPRAKSADGLFRTNAAGMRGDFDPSLERRPGVVRIALLGDSYTFGDEVPNRATWASFLEQDLLARGLAVEVLNLGVNGYGLDQAFLRWESLGKPFHPDVVILGFQAENLLRNLNVFRSVYFPATAMPYSKPRFILNDGELVLVNHPTVPPDELPEVLARLGEHPLTAHERFLSEGFKPHWWLESRLVSLFASLAMRPGQEGEFRVEPETEAIARGILAKLAESVAASGAALIVVHLPRKDDLASILSGHELWSAGVLAWLERDYGMVRPEKGLVEVSERWFKPKGHYTAPYNRRIARALVEPILEALHARPGIASVRDPQ